MALDTLIKKFFPVIIGIVVAIIAYFQASGVVQLVASAALPIDEASLVGSLRPVAAGVRPGAKKQRSMAPLIKHNPFEHGTSLDLPPPPPPEPPALPSGPTSVDASDPLSAEPCQGVTVHIVTESDDPEWSVAVLQGPGEDKGALRRVGDTAGGMEVAYIGFNRIQASPAVWLVKDNKLCQSLLFPEDEEAAKARAKAPAAEPAAAEPAPAARPTGKGAPPLPDELKKKIQKVSDTEFSVDRSVIDNILENQAQLMRSARIVPEKGADGKTVGIRLFGIRPETLLGTLGLLNGDRLETINGFNMGNPEDALNAYARLRTANKLAVQVTRRGKPMTIDFNIK